MCYPVLPKDVFGKTGYIFCVFSLIQLFSRPSLNLKMTGGLLEAILSRSVLGCFEGRSADLCSKRTNTRSPFPTLTDRLVQMALKLILEPIFEADF